MLSFSHKRYTGGVASPFTQNVYLRSLEDKQLPTFYSKGAWRRAAQVQAFLRELHTVVQAKLPTGNVVLVVAGRGDWRALSSFPYGLPLTRSKPPVTVLVPADYPERLLHRFDDSLVRASLAGAAAPGELRESFDLLIGVEWGHALLKASGVTAKQKHLNELMASYLFVSALRSSGADATAERLQAWAAFQRAGCGLDELPLGAVRYPRAKMPLSEVLLMQGVLMNRALALAQQEDWRLALDFWAARAEAGQLKALEERLGFRDGKLKAAG